MTLIYIVRHGRAAASFSDDMDPGLDELGTSQARQAAVLLEPRQPARLISSPLKRAQETALPLADQMNQQATIEDRVAEIPSFGMSPKERGPWLQGILQERWSNLSQHLQDWRNDLIQCLIGINEATVVFSHFVAINVAVGAATDDDSVVCFRPDNGSITVLETDGSRLKLLERGLEAGTRVE